MEGVIYVLLALLAAAAGAGATYYVLQQRASAQFRTSKTEAERLIAEATAQGSQRKLEMNENVKLNLVRIIEGLESISEQRPAAEEAADVA